MLVVGFDHAIDFSTHLIHAGINEVLSWPLLSARMAAAVGKFGIGLLEYVYVRSECCCGYMS